jgi:hypothetical protein
MVKGFGLCSTAVAAVLFASSSTARADSNGNARAVIRGTGNDVTIVYRTPKTAAPDLVLSPSSDVFDEMLRMTASGDDDATIIAFIRLKQAHLPDVIDADAVRELRQAGAGDSVIAVLSSFAAVDIGETGEGSPVYAPQSSQESAAYDGSYPDAVGMGYPFFGSYGGGFFGGGHFGRRSGHHRFPRGSASFHFGKPSFPNGRHVPTHVPRGARMGHRLR